MTAITTAGSGNWSSTTPNAPWPSGTLPVTGDTVTIAVPHAIIGDIDTPFLGSKAAGVGHALRIQGTSVGVFGSLTMSAGKNLNLRGFDRTGANNLFLVDQWGRLTTSGANVIFDAAADDATFYQNNGIWTQVGGTITTPVGNRTWNTVASGGPSGIAPLYYDADNLIIAWPLRTPGIANAANTGLGALGNTSLSFSGQAPAGILATEVASIEACTSAGKYYVDYTNAIVYWYQATTAAVTFTASYKKLAFFGVTGENIGNTDGNQLAISGAAVSYMGEIVNDTPRYIFGIQNKFSSSGTLRNAQVASCSFTFCRKAIGNLDNVIGTVGSMIDLSGNSFQGFDGDDYGSIFGLYGAINSAYISIARSSGVSGHAMFILSAPAGSVVTHTNWSLDDVALLCAGYFLNGLNGSGMPTSVVWPDSTMSGFISGLGGLYDSRQIAGFDGTPGHPAVADGLVSWRGMRVANLGPYAVHQNGAVGYAAHHNFSATLANDLEIAGVVIKNMLSLMSSTGNQGGFAELGYNTRSHFTGAQVIKNTIYKLSGYSGMGFGDQYDNVGPQLLTALLQSSNLVALSAYGVRRGADTSSDMTRVHVAGMDYNGIFGSTTADYSGIARFATFSGFVNVLGVCFFNPSYVAPFSGKTITFTFTSNTDQKLTWDGGTPVQLVQDSGTCSSAGGNTVSGGVVTMSGFMNDTAKTWSADQSLAACPIGTWVKLTGGTGVGQIRRVINRNTATQLQVVPAWVTPPDATSTYVLLKSEVVLTAADANTVSCGVDMRSLPTSTKSDAAMAMALNSLAVDPQFVDATRTLRTWDSSLGGPGTETSAFNRLLAAPTLTRSSLLPYLRAGFAPRAAALATAGHDGGVVGAVPRASLATAHRRRRR